MSVPAGYLESARSAALFEIPAAVFRVTGSERTSWLHGLVTNDLIGMPPGRAAYACALTPKGRVVADLRALVFEDSVLLVSEAVQRERLSDYLQKYLISEDAAVADVSDRWARMSLQGPESVTILGDLLGSTPPGGGVSRQTWGSSELIIAAVDRSGFGGYDVLVPADRAKAWESVLMGRGVASGSEGAIEVLRLEIGWPRAEVDMDDRVLVTEANPPDAISYTKGCYIGQEVVARTTYVGEVHRQRVGLVFELQNPPKNARLTIAGDEVGFVTSAAVSPSLRKAIGMGYVRREFATAGTELGAAGGMAKVAAWPLVDRRSS